MMFCKNKLRRAHYDKYKCRLRDGFTYHCKTRAKEGQVVFFGDSITEMLNVSDWYGEYSVKSGYEVYNRGIGGDSSLGLYRRAKENVLCIKPKAVVILIGTNDLHFEFTPDFIAMNIENLLKLFKEECSDCRVILEAVYPVIEGRAGKRKNKDILEVNRRYAALAEKYGAAYIDLTDKLADEKGNLREDCTYDGLHLSAKGYEVTTKEIVKLLP